VPIDLPAQVPLIRRRATMLKRGARLAELNVLQGVRQLAETPLDKRGSRGRFGNRFCGLKDERLRDSDFTLGSGHIQEEGAK